MSRYVQPHARESRRPNLRDSMASYVAEGDRAARDRAMRSQVASSGGRCHLCGGDRLVLPGETWVADHILPQVYGGTETADNLAKAHSTCNQWRGSRVITSDLLADIERRRRTEIFVELG